jgi:hypothetical protein
MAPCCFTPKFQVLDIQTGRRKSCFVFFSIDSVTGRILHYALGYGATVTETIDNLNFVKHGIWCVPDKRLPSLETIKLLRPDNLKASKCFMPQLNKNINGKDANEAFLPSSKLIVRSRVSRLNLLNFKMLESFVIHCIYDWPQNVLCRIFKPTVIASDVVNDIVDLAVQRVNALLDINPVVFGTRAP